MLDFLLAYMICIHAYMLRQAACHQIAELLDRDFAAVVGLLKPHRPNKKMLAFVVAHFRLGDGDEVATGDVSRHSVRGTSAVQDIILYKKPEALLAGKVWAHLNVNGNYLTLIQLMDCTAEDRVDGTAHWRLLEDYEFIATDSIQDPLVWCDLGGGSVRTLVPRDSYE